MKRQSNRPQSAIDRLAALASEEPRSAPGIARILSVYVKELSRELPAKDAPETNNQKSLSEQADKLSAEPSDIEHAVQVLGKLREISGMTLDHDGNYLKRVNLQGFNLRGLNFENVSFRHAKLQGASLGKLRLPKSSLSCVKPNGARLIYSHIEGADFTQVKLRGIFIEICF